MHARRSEERFTLALMHIHYDRNVNLNKVVDLFAEMHPTGFKLRVVCSLSPEIHDFLIVCNTVLQYKCDISSVCLIMLKKGLKIHLRPSKIQILTGVCPRPP